MVEPDVGVDMTKEGAHAYYTSLIQLYASWDVDFIKIDDSIGYCSAGQTRAPYHADEIDAIASAVETVGRPMALSLSPGDGNDPAFAPLMRERVEMSRISPDFWDRWSDVKRQFDLLDRWSGYIGDGFWPDADMLPFGRIGKNFPIAENDHGPEHESHLNFDERRTLMTLWCIARSPLFLGGNMVHVYFDD